ncbi:MAG TPA: hypothetical protein VNV85_00340 [Puia sp.]|jgi:hypothetical protein|nr:hypothetical protein [Puia sp.]
MKNKNYTATIEVANAPKDVFNHIKDVSNWRAKDAGEDLLRTENRFNGQGTKLNDEFVICHPDRH